MNRRVLIVDDMADVRRTAHAALCDRYDVHTAESAARALEITERYGPFATVVVDHDMPDMNGVCLLSKLQKRWPDTTRIMLTGYAELSVAIAALHEGAIYRFLTKPVGPDELSASVEAALAQYREVEAERLLTEQLQFSREALLSLTETLERRLAMQLGRLRGLQDFTSRLNQARSLDEVAELAAETASKLLDGRSVAVALEDSSCESGVEATYGDGLSLRTYIEAVCTNEGQIGHVQLDEANPEGCSLSDSDRRLLTALAASTGIAARNQIHRRERDDAQHATIFALARLAEFRDDETGKHLERVSEYCRLIAEGLRGDGYYESVITDGFIEDLVLSAPLHDIGKVGIPDSILQKPGKLDEDEWEIMRRHTVIGAETLRNVLETSGEQSFLRMGHEIAWCHHEKWDGNGYPRGLEGDEIPLSARIAALADVYDALTTVRPYKHAWTHEKALEYICDQQGSHFEPSVVTAFMKRSAEVDRIRERLADLPEDFERAFK